MKILKAVPSLNCLPGVDRRAAHEAAKRGHWVKIVVEGAVRGRSVSGTFKTFVPKVAPFCWVRMDDVMKLRDERKPRGRPFKFVECHEGKAKTFKLESIKVRA